MSYFDVLLSLDHVLLHAGSEVGHVLLSLDHVLLHQGSEVGHALLRKIREKQDMNRT